VIVFSLLSAVAEFSRTTRSTSLPREKVQLDPKCWPRRRSTRVWRSFNV